MTTPSIHDFFEYFLKAADLHGKTHTVTIAAVVVEQVFDTRAKQLRPSLVVKFVHGRRSWKLNKSQAAALAEIASTEDYTAWPGLVVVLSPAPAGNGKDTIAVTAAAAGQLPDPEEPQRSMQQNMHELGFEDGEA